MVLAAINVLNQFATRHVEACPPDEQIEVYLALAETLQDSASRARARELAQAISKVSALQLDFKELLPRQ